MKNDTENKEGSDIPSVASDFDASKIVMGGLIAASLIIIGLMIANDVSSKTEGSSIKAPPALGFEKTSSHFSEPYIAEQEKPHFETKETEALDPAQIEMTRAAIKRFEELEKEKLKRIASDQLIFDKRSSASAQVHSAGSPANANPASGFDTRSPVELQNLDTLVPQGTMVDATLETAIQSDLPGMVRAVLSRPVYGFQGQKTILPRGSRLIGEYDSALVRGQRRIFIIWSRIIRPDGVSVAISSPGTDTLGSAGLSGIVDTRFFERFGSSLLLSIIDGGISAGVNAAANENTSNVAISTGNGFSNAADIALKNSIDIKPRIHVHQGTNIKVFLKQDLDFSSLK